MKKPIRLTDDDVLSECRYQSSQASGSEYAADELTADRTNALKYYMGKARGDEVEGRSTVISRDVADMIDSMISQIMPTFSQDNIVQFEATSEQDETQARTESNFCNHVFMEKNNGYITIQTLLKDALLSKNCIAKVYVDITEDIERERYKDLEEMELYQVLQPTKPNQEVVVTKFEEKKGNVNLKRVTTKRKLIVAPVPPEHFAVTPDLKSPHIQDATYCRELFYITKSELIQMGYSAEVVMDLPRSSSDTKADSIERNQVDSESDSYNNNLAMQLVQVEEHYIRIDQDGDGIAELHKVVTCENILLSNEEAECIPYASGVGFLMGHRFYGQSVYDKLKDVQDMKTHFLRQWADNALVSNHKKYMAVEDDVNLDDLLSGRPNGVIRVKSLGALQEMATNDIGGSCQMALDYYDRVRTARSGSALDLQSNQMAMPSNIGDQGVNVLVANLEQVSALITRNFSETLITSLYTLIHKFLKNYFPEDMNAKINGQWSQTNPSQWLEREQINVSIPPTRTEKTVQQIALEKVIIQQQSHMANGQEGILVDKGSHYSALLDHAKLSGIDNPEKYWIDPDSEPAQMAAQQGQMMQQQQMQEQQAKQDAMNQQLIQAQIMEIQRNWENDKEELQFNYTELEKKLEMEKYKTDVSAEIDEAKIVGDATTKIELKSLDAVGNDYD